MLAASIGRVLVAQLEGKRERNQQGCCASRRPRDTTSFAEDHKYGMTCDRRLDVRPATVTAGPGPL